MSNLCEIKSPITTGGSGEDHAGGCSGSADPARPLRNRLEMIPIGQATADLGNADTHT